MKTAANEKHIVKVDFQHIEDLLSYPTILDLTDEIKEGIGFPCDSCGTLTALRDLVQHTEKYRWLFLTRKYRVYLCLPCAKSLFPKSEKVGEVTYYKREPTMRELGL